MYVGAQFAGNMASDVVEFPLSFFKKGKFIGEGTFGKVYVFELDLENLHANMKADPEGFKRLTRSSHSLTLKVAVKKIKPLP